MKTFNVIGIRTILTLLGFGYYLKTKQETIKQIDYERQCN